MLSLHFDGCAGTARARRDRLVPARHVRRAASADAPRRAAPLVLLPWRDVALRHAVREPRARRGACCRRSSCAGWGRRACASGSPLPLLGVNAPGLLLECAHAHRRPPTARALDDAATGCASWPRAIAEGVAALRGGTSEPRAPRWCFGLVLIVAVAGGARAGSRGARRRGAARRRARRRPPTRAGTGFRSARLYFAARDGDSLVSEPRELLEQPRAARARRRAGGRAGPRPARRGRGGAAGRDLACCTSTSTTAGC